MVCPECLGLMFVGSKHCSHCGAKAVAALTAALENGGDCPCCKTRLTALTAGDVSLYECVKCAGFWADTDTFESICADGEKQAAVLSFAGARADVNEPPSKISYVPCPACKRLMNRSNFARSSGVIVDLCKQHGVWFDAEELPKIIAFVRKGGMDRMREREKLAIQEDRGKLRDEQRQAAIRESRAGLGRQTDREDESGIAGFISSLFD
jgi:Zn-finger nucleic acid-binding protein